MGERKDEILAFDKFKNKRIFGSKAISGGTFYSVSVDDQGEISAPQFIFSSEIQGGGTVFTNGILNEIFNGDADASINGRDHIFQVDGDNSSFVLFYNPTYGLFPDSLEAMQDQGAFESGQGFSTLAIQLGSVMISLNAEGKNVRFMGHSQGGAITAAASRFAFDNGGSLSSIRIALHGAPINDAFAAASFKRFGMSNDSYNFRAQALDPVHKIGGGNGSFGTRVRSFFQIFNLFGDRYQSPHTLPCAPDPKATCS